MSISDVIDMQYAAWTMLAHMVDRLEREWAHYCHQYRKRKTGQQAIQPVQPVQDRFKLAHGEEVAHASLHLIEKLDGPHVGDIPFDLWKANCALVLTCVAKQQK